MGGDELSGAPGTKQVSLEVQNCLFGPLLWLSHQVDCGRFARVYVHFLCIAFQAYSIDETPVTNARFRQFVKETKYRTPCAAVLKLIGMTLQSLSHESEPWLFECWGVIPCHAACEDRCWKVWLEFCPEQLTEQGGNTSAMLCLLKVIRSERCLHKCSAS